MRLKLFALIVCLMFSSFSWGFQDDDVLKFIDVPGESNPRVRFFRGKHKVKVRRVSLPEQPDNKLLLIAGDRVRIRFAPKLTKYPDFAFTSSGPLHPEDNSRGFWLATEPGQATLVLHTELGQVTIPVTIQNPQPLPEKKLLGIGTYLASTEPKKADGRSSLRYWIDQTVANGKNFLRVVPLSGIWARHRQSPFYKTESGKYDITRLDPDWAMQFRADLYYAAQKGVTVMVDIFDEVGLKTHDGRWDRNPFNKANNIHDYITAWQPYPGGPSGQRLDPQNLFEHAVKGDYGPESQKMAQLLKQYAVNITKLVPEPHIICTGNELQGRSEEREIIKWIHDQTSLRLAVNGEYLWGNLAEWETWPMRAQTLANDHYLFQRVDIIRLHHCDHKHAQEFYQRLDTLWKTHPHLKVIFDDDGAGSGWIRGKNNRPTPANITKAINEVQGIKGFYGYMIKILTDRDSLNILATVPNLTPNN